MCGCCCCSFFFLPFFGQHASCCCSCSYFCNCTLLAIILILCFLHWQPIWCAESRRAKLILVSLFCIALHIVNIVVSVLITSPSIIRVGSFASLFHVKKWSLRWRASIDYFLHIVNFFYILFRCLLLLSWVMSILIVLLYLRRGVRQLQWNTFCAWQHRQHIWSMWFVNELREGWWQRNALLLQQWCRIMQQVL